MTVAPTFLLVIPPTPTITPSLPHTSTLPYQYPNHTHFFTHLHTAQLITLFSNTSIHNHKYNHPTHVQAHRHTHIYLTQHTIIHHTVAHTNSLAFTSSYTLRHMSSSTYMHYTHIHYFITHTYILTYIHTLHYICIHIHIELS